VPAIVVFLYVGGATRYPRIDRHTSALRLVLRCGCPHPQT
jgi:hypothetical protein